MRAENRRKQDQIDKFVLDFIKEYGVEKEESIEALCPSGCGTKLTKHTFLDVFKLDMEPSLQNAEEDLYCPKCGIRWIAEQHSPLKTEETENKTQKIELDIPTSEMVLLRQMAKDKGKDINQMLSEIITEKTNQEEASNGKTENLQLAKSEACVITLEMVAAQLNESDDISVIKNEIAGDLLVAKIAFDLEKNGKVEQEQVKQYVAELF